jgi:hypothetical protein
MLDPWIIEEIRRREEEERGRDHQPAVIELPVHGPTRRDEREQGKQEEETPRGVAIIEI